MKRSYTNNDVINLSLGQGDEYENSTYIVLNEFTLPDVIKHLDCPYEARRFLLVNGYLTRDSEKIKYIDLGFFDLEITVDDGIAIE